MALSLYLPRKRQNETPSVLGNTIWLARDTDGRLWLHFFEPSTNTLSGGSWRSASCVDVSGTPLDTKMEHLQFEDAPVKLCLSEL